jgi:hypothetical protein
MVKEDTPSLNPLGPLRLQRRRTAGARLPPGTVNATRPGLLGNPFIHPDPRMAIEAWGRHMGRGSNSYRIEPGGLQIARNANPRTLHWTWHEWFLAALPSLQGRNIACWCALCPAHADGKPFGLACEACAPCHVDSLGRRANGMQPLGCEAISS